MKALRDLFGQIGTDLVRKRLWPVALALLVGLIAVTVIGTSGEHAAPELAGSVPVTPTAPAAPAVATPGDPVAERGDDAKRVRNPFFDPPSPSGASSATTATGGSSAGSSAAEPKRASDDQPRDSGPVTRAPSGAASAPSAAGARVSTANVYYRTVVRWRRAQPSRRAAIARLTPLGGRTEPAALFLGVTAPAERYAIFVLGPHATTSGSHHCAEPSNCRMIGLRAGETKMITVRPATGGVRHYRLRIAAIQRVTTSLRHARAMRGHVHGHGRSVLRAFWRNPATVRAISTVSYRRARGLLVASDAKVSATRPVR